MKHKNTLQNRLFFNYSLIMSLILTACFAMLSMLYIHTERRRIADHLTTLTSTIVNHINQETDKLSNASMNTIYSKPLKNAMDHLNPQSPDWTLISEVNHVIGSIIGPYSTVSQINVYSMKDYMVGWGTLSLTHQVDLSSQPWYEKVNAMHGYKYITPPSPNDDFIKISPYMKDRYYISLYRMYFDSAYQPQGVVEVVQDCNRFFSYLKELQAENPGVSIHIADSSGAVIYPYNGPGRISRVTEAFPQYSDLTKSGSMIRDVNGRNMLLSMKNDKKSGWNIMVTQDSWLLYERLAPFLLIFTGFLIAFLAVSMCLCFHVAKTLLSPLNSMKTQLEKINLNEILSSDTPMLIDYQEDTTAEIESLFQIYNTMYLSLKDSSQSIINAKAAETRAKLFATQSMLKPHFLYNSLTNISIMAENNMTPQIISFCNNLSRYLRYISSDGLADVDISTEAAYSVNYLDCMKIRYADKLHYKISIPVGLNKLKIPKLTLQPLIENSLKYAFPNSPPWIIHITAEEKDGFCYLSVTDNGVGFSKEALDNLQQQLHDIRHSRDIYSLKIGGLGIRNVFLRLLFMYGDQADLLITGTDNAGARIVIKLPMNQMTHVPGKGEHL